MGGPQAAVAPVEDEAGGSFLEVLLVVALEVALIVALHLTAGPTYAVPVDDITGWLQGAEPTVVLVAMARLVGLAIGYWLLSTTVLYAAAHYLGWRSMTNGLRFVTLPVVRRVVQGVTAVSLTSASLMGPAAVSVGPALADTVVVAQDDADTTSPDAIESPTSTDYRPDAAGWPQFQADQGGGFWLPSAVSSSLAAADSYVVQRNDHLWSIAERAVRAGAGREVTEDEVCRYWVRLVEANRATIRSGDPDLIYPDEVLTLPPVFETD